MSWIEDAYLTLLVSTAFFCLGQMFYVQRKSKTFGSNVHVWTGVGQFVLGLYAVGLERVYREIPGWEWMWGSLALCMAGCLTVGPLMKYYKGPKVYLTLFRLGQDFVISFQGIQLTAWSAMPDAPAWLYWAVMPFWWWSVQKLLTTAKYVSVLVPEEDAAGWSGPLLAFRERSQKELDGIKPDAPTFIYTGLNTGAAIFDNAWMALYTLKGPAGFWAYSAALAPHDLELSLIKPAAGSLTVSSVVFLGTLVARRKIPAWLAGGLNVMLASVGPWIILFWHKLVAPEETWVPQFMPFPEDVANPLLAYEFAQPWTERWGAPLADALPFLK